MQNIPERILNGESLGSPIKDYLFIHDTVGYYPGLEKELQQIQKDVAENKGEQVLVLYTEFHKAGNEGCVRRLFDQTEVQGMQLGMINGELKLNLSDGNLFIPSTQHVRKGAANIHSPELPYLKDWEKQEGDIIIPRTQFFLPWHIEKYGLEILFGDEVQFYFSSNEFELKSYQKLKKQTEDRKGLLEQSLHFASHNKVNPEYIAALNVLGVEMPPRVKEKYDAQILEQKLNILAMLRRGDNTNQTLQQAIVLGMHKEQQEIELEAGVKMNIPEYIRAQCEKYKIKLPE